MPLRSLQWPIVAEQRPVVARIEKATSPAASPERFTFSCRSASRFPLSVKHGVLVRLNERLAAASQIKPSLFQGTSSTAKTVRDSLIRLGNRLFRGDHRFQTVHEKVLESGSSIANHWSVTYRLAALGAGPVAPEPGTETHERRRRSKDFIHSIETHPRLPPSKSLQNQQKLRQSRSPVRVLQNQPSSSTMSPTAASEARPSESHTGPAVHRAKALSSSDPQEKR